MLQGIPSPVKRCQLLKYDNAKAEETRVRKSTLNAGNIIVVPVMVLEHYRNFPTIHSGGIRPLGELANPSTRSRGQYW